MQEISAQSANNHTSIFRSKIFGTLILFFAIFEVLASLLLPTNQVTLASDLTTENILNAVNEQRGFRNLPLLNTNPKLSYAAQSKADDMQARHYFAHVDPDEKYIWDKIIAAGYTPYSQLGENLAIEFYDTQGLISAWMNSPTHRANLLNENFKDQGMGLTFGNTSQNQYFSAIANTFGTLAIAPKPKTSPPPTPAVKPSPSKTKTVQTQPAPAPVTSAAPLSQPSPPPQTIAGAPLETRNAKPLAQNLQAQGATTVENSLPQKTFSAPAITNQVPLNNFNVNRYLIFGGGIILVMLLLADFKEAFEKKFASLDKKANNLTVLLISLILVAFVYWL